MSGAGNRMMVKEFIQRLRERARTAAGAWYRRTAAQLEPAYAKARTRYQKLEPREKLLVRVAASLLLMLALYNLVYLPVQAVRQGFADEIISRQTELLEVRRLAASYARLKSEESAAQSRTVPGGKDFSLFSVIEGTLTLSVGRDKIGAITPSDRRISDDLVQYSVDLKLTDVSLAQLVDTFYGLDNLSVPVTITRVNIKRRFQNLHSYDVELNCAALGKE